MSMIRKVAYLIWLAALCLLVGVPMANGANPDPDIAACDNVKDLDARVAGCTRLLARKNLPAKSQAILHLQRAQGTGAGTLLAFSTAPGQIALDGDGANSPFSLGLARHLGTPGLEVQQMLTRVRAEVVSATHGKQVPWSNSSLLGEVYLSRKALISAPRAQSGIYRLVALRVVSRTAELGRYRAFVIPSALMREASVVGLMSSISAAPPGPNTLPPQA